MRRATTISPGTGTPRSSRVLAAAIETRRKPARAQSLPQPGLRMGEAPVGADDDAVAVMALHGEGEQPVSGQHAGALRENRRELAEIDEDIGRDHQIGRGVGPAGEEGGQPGDGELVVKRLAVGAAASARARSIMRGERSQPARKSALAADRRAHQPGAAAEVVDRREAEAAARPADRAGPMHPSEGSGAL